MDAYLKSLVNSKAANFARWDDVFKNYLAATFGENDFDEEKYKQIILDTHSVFVEIINVYLNYGKFQDNWSTPSFFAPPFTLETEVKSQKLSCGFTFGADEEGFFLESYIHHPENLRNMNDDFWKDLIELSKFGKFEFIESVSPWEALEQERKPSLKNTNSSIFRLLRNYVLLNLHNSDLSDFGSLSVKWSSHESWESLLIAGSQAFKILYKTNYSLWRTSYIRNTGRKYNKSSKL